MQHITIPESLQAQFLASCAAVDIDGQRALAEWMQDYMQEIEALKIAKSRAENPEGFISLEQLASDHGLAI